MIVQFPSNVLQLEGPVVACACPARTCGATVTMRAARIARVHAPLIATGSVLLEFGKLTTTSLRATTKLILPGRNVPDCRMRHDTFTRIELNQCPLVRARRTCNAFGRK